VITLRALGPLEVRVDGANAPDDLLWTRNLALLLYLARAPAHRCTRDHAIGLLWPEKDQEKARGSLREALRVLRRCIGESHLRAEADQLQLAAGAVELDTDRFDQLIAHQDWAGAAPLVTGPFAEGFALPDSSAFEDWLLAERSHWRGRSMDVLLRHAEQRLDAGDLLGADDPLRRALDLDEELHESRIMLINVFTKQSRWNDALEQANAYLTKNPKSPQRADIERIKGQIEKALNQ